MYNNRFLFRDWQVVSLICFLFPIQVTTFKYSIHQFLLLLPGLSFSSWLAKLFTLIYLFWIYVYKDSNTFCVVKIPFNTFFRCVKKKNFHVDPKDNNQKRKPYYKKFYPLHPISPFYLLTIYHDSCKIKF